MTYNIHHGKSVDKQLNLDQIGYVIEKSNADIIGLNEVDKYFSNRSEFEDQISWLAKHLKMEQAFTHSIKLKSRDRENERQYGNALLSRFPIVNKKDHHFNFIKGLVEGRSMLEATLEIDNKMLQVYVTHLSLNPFLHNKQTSSIIDILSKSSSASIVMGDWNMKPQSNGWKNMTDVYTDAWEVAGEGAGYTYPSTRPKRRLDYIFMSDHLSVTEAKIIKANPKASDHLPLRISFSL
ncbi:endonuclease/exonuclease/phosphatase family protein [Ornithinibacillus salinisoli]